MCGKTDAAVVMMVSKVLMIVSMIAIHSLHDNLHVSLHDSPHGSDDSLHDGDR